MGERRPAQRTPDASSAPEAAEITPPDPSDARATSTLQGPSAEARLRAFERSPSPLDEAAVIASFEALAREGREGLGVDLMRRLVDAHPDADRLAVRLAEALASRGDEDAALALLTPSLLRVSSSPSGLMLAGELAQRRGDEAAARAYYERVLAHDIEYPSALDRVRRLEGARRSAGSIAGATLLTEGAVARGRYRIEQELGRGGAGIVFAAMDVHLGRRVALKIYQRRTPADRERLHNEARSAARLEHPAIVRILDLDDALFSIAMELMAEGSIRARAQKDPVPFERVVDWFRQTLVALEFVHEHGVAHRDIKPGNLLLDGSGRVVLTDFGIALPIGESPRDASRVGEGTLAYMPLEQRAGAAANPSADVFAFGVSLREVLGTATGTPPKELFDLASVCMRQDARSRPSVRWLLEQL